MAKPLVARASIFLPPGGLLRSFLFLFPLALALRRRLGAGSVLGKHPRLVWFLFRCLLALLPRGLLLSAWYIFIHGLLALRARHGPQSHPIRGSQMRALLCWALLYLVLAVTLLHPDFQRFESRLD